MFGSSEVKDVRLRPPRFLVHWRSRAMLTDRSVYQAVVKTASVEGFGVEIEQAVPKGKSFNLEFFVNSRDKETRLRAKLNVIYCMILSGNRGAYMEAKILNMSDGDAHTYNNVLQALGNAKEFDLRL